MKEVKENQNNKKNELKYGILYLQKVNIVQFRQAKLLGAQNEDTATHFHDVYRGYDDKEK